VSELQEFIRPDLIAEEVAREHRLKVCCCCSVGTALRTGNPMDPEAMAAGYVCVECSALHYEIEQARVDYLARIDAAMQSHHALHDARAQLRKEDEEALWADKTSPQPLDRLLAEWDAEFRKPASRPPSWVVEKNPEIAWLDQLPDDEKEFYRSSTARSALIQHYPWLTEVEWRAVLS